MVEFYVRVLRSYHLLFSQIFTTYFNFFYVGKYLYFFMSPCWAKPFPQSLNTPTLTSFMYRLTLYTQL